MSAARNCKSPTFLHFRRKHILLPIDGYKINSAISLSLLQRSHCHKIRTEVPAAAARSFAAVAELPVKNAYAHTLKERGEEYD